MPRLSHPSPRILVRGVNWLGDAVMTTPALQRLRESQPLAHIALLTPEKLAGLWTHHPDLDQVLTIAPRESVWSVARHLRKLDFTHALVLPNSPRSALEVALAGIPVRFGLARPWRSFLLTHRIPPRPESIVMHKRTRSEIKQLTSAQPMPARATMPHSAHHLHHYLHLAAALGASPESVPPRLLVTPAEVESVQRRFGFSVASGKARPWLLGLNAGAEYGPAKRWPRERFVAAAVEVLRRTGGTCWIFGGPADVALAEGIAAEILAAKPGPPDSVRSLAGQTSLRELCAALKACDVVLTNDTGPMHVAAAVGARVVTPFGSTSPELTGPGRPGETRHSLLTATVPCAPCFLRKCPIDFRCMTSISVEQVVMAVLRDFRQP